MIRYYTVSGDLDNGYDFEYIFRFHKDAEAKYSQITHVPFKSLTATDDKEGDITLMRHSRDD